MLHFGFNLCRHLFLLVVLPMIFISCEKDNDTASVNNTTEYQITITYEIEDCGDLASDLEAANYARALITENLGKHPLLKDFPPPDHSKTNEYIVGFMMGTLRKLGFNLTFVKKIATETMAITWRHQLIDALDQYIEENPHDLKYIKLERKPHKIED